MTRKLLQRTQLPARPAQPKGPAKPSWWRPDRLPAAGWPGLAALGGPWLKGPWGRGAKIGVAVLGVLVVLVVAANILLSADFIEARIAERVQEKTGHEFAVGGSTLLLFRPGPYIVIADAKISDPAGETGIDLSIGRLKIDLGFGGLFGGAVEAERIVLVRPVLTLRLDDEAQSPQWSGVAPLPDAPKPVRFAKAQASGVAATDERPVHVKELRIEDGTVVILRDDEAKERRIEHINAQAHMPALAGPLIGGGVFDWKRQTVDFSFEMASPADLQAKRPARLQLAAETNALAARFDGTIVASPSLAGQGKLAAKARSIPSMLALIQESPPVASALGDGELASDLSWSNGEITLSNARFALEHAAGEGQAVIALKRPRPHVRAALALDHLDLNPFLGGAEPDTPDRAQVVGANEAPPAEAILPQAVPPPAPRAPTRDWFSRPAAPPLAPPAAQVEQAITPPPTAAEISDTAAASQVAAAPADFDADVNLNIRKTQAGQLTIGPSSLGLTFHDGLLTARLGGMELYGGQARGTVTVDATKPVPDFEGDFRMDGVETQPLLEDAARFTMVSGRAKLNLKISGSGNTADAVKSSLRGNGNVLVSNGAIEGLDLTALIRGLGTGTFDLRQGPGAKTAFSALGGSFTISDGIAETRNLQMISPLLKVGADGTVDLARSNIDIMARPEIVAGPEGRDGANDLAGLSIPFRVEGPLDAPRIQPEIGGLFADTESTSNTVNKIGEALRKRFKGRPVGEAIGRFLGGIRIGPGPGAAPQALAGPQGEGQGAEPARGDASTPGGP